MVHDDRAAVRERPDGMRRVRRNEGHRPGPGGPGLTADGDGELTLDDVPDLLVGMLVLVDRRARRHRVVPEGHALRVEVAPLPPRQRLLDGQLTRLDERHLILPRAVSTR